MSLTEDEEEDKHSSDSSYGQPDDNKSSLFFSKSSLESRDEPRKIFSRLSDRDKYERFIIMSRKIAMLKKRIGELKRADCHRCAEI